MKTDTELTVRALILGAVIAAVFTAANIYLGLRVGITIASSIPAAVISMGVLRALRTGNIRENNIVQTVASAGGTLSAIIFVLPGLIMVGWWRSFPFLTTFLICTLAASSACCFPFRCAERWWSTRRCPSPRASPPRRCSRRAPLGMRPVPMRWSGSAAR